MAKQREVEAKKQAVVSEQTEGEASDSLDLQPAAARGDASSSALPLDDSDVSWLDSAPPPRASNAAPPPLPAARASGPAPKSPPPKRSKAVSRSRKRRAPDNMAQGTSTRPPVPPMPARWPELARELLARCENELARQPEPLRAARLHFEIARLCEHPLEDLRRASTHYRKAHELRPQLLPALRGTRRVLLRRKEYRAALPCFEQEVDLVPEADRKASLLYIKGRVWEDSLGRHGEARAAFGEALEHRPGDPGLLLAVEHATGNTAELDGVYEKMAEALADDPAARAHYLLRRAQLADEEERLRDAVALYQAALELAPDCGARPALQRLHHALGRWQDAIELLQHDARYSADPRVRAYAAYRISLLHAERLGQQEPAVVSLQQALEHAPNNPLLLDEAVHRFHVARCWQPLREALERRAELATAAAERVVWLHRLGETLEHGLHDPTTAAAFYERALHEEPTHGPSLEALERHYTATEAWEPLVAMWQRQAESVADSAERAHIFADIADVHERRLQRSSDAIAQHRRALAIDPAFDRSLRALERLLLAHGEAEALIQLYRRALDGQPHPAERTLWLLKIATLYEDRLRDPHRAADAYREALSVQQPPHNAVGQDEARHPADSSSADRAVLLALHGLQRTAEQAGDFDALVEALELEAEQARASEIRAALHLHAAEVLEEQGEHEAALQRYGRVLELQPGRAGRPEGIAFCRVGAFRGLARLYHRLGRWADLLAVYEQRATEASRPAEAARLLVTMGRLAEGRVGSPERAARCYREALRLDPDHAPAREALERHLRRRGSYAELAELLRERIERTPEAADRAWLAFRIGELKEEQLDDKDGAVQAYEEALQLDPAQRFARLALTRLRGELGVWRRLAQDLREQATLAQDPTSTREARLAEGWLWARRLREPQRAMECFESVLEDAPSDVHAWLALEPLYRQAGKHERAAEAYEGLARELHGTLARAAMLRALGDLQAARGVGQPEDLRRSRLELVELAPGDLHALESLEALAFRTHDWALLREVDGHLAASREDGAMASAYRTRLGEALEAIDRPAEAEQAYRTALEGDPDSLGAVCGLTRLALRHGDPERLRQAAEREAHTGRRPQEAADLLLRCADARLAFEENPSETQADLVRALELHPDHADAATALVGLETSRGRIEPLLEVLERTARHAQGAERIAACWLQIARLQRAHMQDAPEAIAALQRALEANANHVEALREIGGVYREEAQWAEAAQALQRVVQLSSDQEVLRDAHEQLAWLFEAKLHEPSKALSSLQAVVGLEPEHREAWMRLAELQARLGLQDKALKTAAHLQELAHDDAQRAAAKRCLAHVEHARGHMAAALSALHAAVALEGPDGDAAEELRRSVARQGDWAPYITALRAFLQRRRAAGSAASAYRALAEALAERADDPGAALDTLEKGLEATDGHPVVRFALAERRWAAGDLDTVVHEARQVLVDDVTHVDAWRLLARALAAQARDEEAAATLRVLVALGVESPADAGEPAPPDATLAAETSVTDLLARVGPSMPRAQAAAELLTLLEPAARKLYPADLEAYGVGSQDRIGPRSEHPLRAIGDRLATLLGVPEYDLFLHRCRNVGVTLELGDRPVILAPHRILKRPPNEQTFMLAQPMAAVAKGHAAMLKLTPRELEVMLAAASRTADRHFGEGLTADEELDEQARRISRALGRKGRKAAEAAARAYLRTVPLDFAAWVACEAQSARRIALLLTRDPAAAVAVLRDAERNAESLTGLELVQQSDAVADLLRFWASPKGAELRAALAG